IVNEGVEIPPPSSERRSSARSHWGVEDHEFLFGCISVFVPEKGQRHLIEALREVRKSHPEARLLLAGDGHCRGELQALAKRLGQSEADRKSTRLNSSHQIISYAVFCLKKKK